MREEAPGRWGGPNSFEISGLRFVSNDKKSSLRMETISKHGETKGFSYEKYLKFKTELGFNPGTGNWDRNIFSKDVKIPEIIPLFGQSDWNEISIENIEVVSEGETAFSIEKASFGATGQGLEESIGSYGYKAGFKGLDFAVESPELKSMIPNIVTFDVSIGNYPQQTITSQTVETFIRVFALFKTLEQTGDFKSEDLMMGFLSEYQKSLQDIQAKYAADMDEAMFAAKTDVTLNGLTLEAEKYFVQAEGRVQMDRQAVRKASGAFTISVSGLDNIVSGASLSSALGKDEKSLAFIRALGKEVKGADGKTVSRFRFDITPEGPIFLNGVDVTEVFKTLQTF
jgi:hypothetical protein